MKNFKGLSWGILSLCLGIFMFSSCDKDEDTPVPATGAVDVAIQGIKVDAATKYAIVISASSNYEIKSAKVTAPGTGGKVYQLTATSNKKLFVYVPASADYAAELPVKGDYSYEITTSNDEKVSGKDAVGDEKTVAIAIKTATMASQKLKTTWDKVQGGDAYQIRLYNANKTELLFQGATLASDKAEFEFGSTTAGWATGKSPVANTNYVVELIAVKYETGVTTNKEANLQFITLDSKTIKWE